MADDLSVDMEGFEELEEKLAQLANVESKKLVRAGLYAGSTAIASSMMSAGSGVSGELGQALGEKSSWSKSVRMTDELSGEAHVKPKGSLPEMHTGQGSPKTFFQPRGKKYHRSLKYLVKLMELGGGGGKYSGPHFPILTATFAANSENYIARVLARIKEGLQKYGIQ